MFPLPLLLCHSGVDTLKPIPKKSCIFSFSLALRILLLLHISGKIQFGTDVLHTAPILPASTCLSCPNEQ